MMDRAPWKRSAAWAALGAAALVLAACSTQIRLDAPERQPLLPPAVDSVAVPTFAKAPGLAINAADLALFHTLLREQLDTRPDLRTFDAPPTTLANSVRLLGRLDAFDVREARADALFLREINLEVTLRLLPATGDKELATVTRGAGYQRLYLPNQETASLVYDLRNAVRELALQLAEVIAPLPGQEDVVLDKGLDPVTGALRAHPLLVRGNQEAKARRYENAMRLWRLVLFDPTQPTPEEPLYRVSLRTLRLLQRMEVPKQVLDRLRPLSEKDPLPLKAFQAAVRGALGGASQFEPAVLEHSGHAEDGVHLNLATAHFNLAALYEAEKRWDLTAFHLASAQVHYPAPEHLEAWSRVQKNRNLYPGDLAVEDALAPYLRVPPPFTARVVPGLVADRVRPAPILQPVSVLTPPAAGPAAASGAPPAEPAPPPAVQPVRPDGPRALPPVQPEGPVELPPIEQPGNP